MKKIITNFGAPRRSSALLGLGLSVFSMQVAHAGSYTNEATPQAGVTTTLYTDASLSRTAPVDTFPPPIENNPPGTSVTGDYHWTWTPAGPLGNDPAPLRSVTLDYVIGGGPLKIIPVVTDRGGYARVTANASLSAETNTRAGWFPLLGGEQTETEYALQGTQTATLHPQYDGLQMSITNNPQGTLSFLKFVNHNDASSGCQLETTNGASGAAQFNNMSIRTTFVTLQPQ